ncbi:MAG: DUF475 domain-containing protein [Vicinamibacteria bacterium]
MQDFRFSFLVTLVCLVGAFYWGTSTPAGGIAAVTLTLILGVMEVSLSFDNAVVNAGVLKEMDEKWRQLFLTVGILVAVFGMRLLFPIVIVSVATGLRTMDVVQMALKAPAEYSKHLVENHVVIAAFGGMFLLLVFLNFIFDQDKELHWLGPAEEKLAKLGKLDSFSAAVAMGTLILTQRFLPVPDRSSAVLAGIFGIILYIAVDGLGALFESEEGAGVVAKGVKRSGVAAFIYLEILDASFSFDGVIGAFAITQDVVIIMLGLTIGAMFVRSLTVYLVHKGTLDEYVFLEHGAHYAIGVLAIIMLVSTVYHIPEVVTGLIGVAFIALSLISSISYRNKNLRESAEAGSH